jgi:hypothetical protein
MPEGRVQYVEQLTPEAIWTEANLAHANGVTALKAIYVVADDPAETAARWARFSGLLPTPEGALVRLDCTRGRVFVGTQAELKRVLGAAPAAPGLAGYRLGCRHPEGFAARCRSLGLAVHRSSAGHAVSLPASLGGVWLI